MVPLVDSHCHLNDPAFAESLPAVLARAEAAGVRACVVPAYDADSLPRTAALVARYPGRILPAFGLHPWFIGPETDLAVLTPYLDGAVALGEIGLDAAIDEPSLPVQLPLFADQVALAVKRDLPVLLHCRRAHDPLYEVLRAHQGRLRGVLHAYSGSRELLGRFLDLGLYVAFAGSVTQSRAGRARKAAAAVPLERLLVETDAPSIATATTAAAAVEPRHVLEVARAIAELRGLTLEAVCERTTQNAARLFGRAFP